LGADAKPAVLVLALILAVTPPRDLMPSPAIWLVSVALRAHRRSTTQVTLWDTPTTPRGGAMSRALGTAAAHDDAIIRFLLFCLEIYRAEQERRRKLH